MNHCMHDAKIKGSHITDDEIRGAEEKFAESLHLAQLGMYNLLENDVNIDISPNFSGCVQNAPHSVHIKMEFFARLTIVSCFAVLQVEQVSQMYTFSEGLLEYHQQCTEILKGLVETLQIK